MTVSKRMNIKIILSLMSLGLWVCRGTSQSTIESHINLSDAIQIIEEKFQVNIAYDYSVLHPVRLANLTLGPSLATTMESLIKDRDLQYMVLDSQKVLLRIKENPSDIKKQVYLVSGQVLDRETGEPLPYAALFTNDLQTGTTSDESGKFSLEINSQKSSCILNIQYLGYYSQKQRVLLPHSKELIISLGIQPQLIPSIVIAEQEPLVQRDQAQNPKIRFSQWNSGFSPVGRDALRALHFMPGVQGHNELTANPVIRGGNPEGNSLLLNEMPILKVDHYFGIFSVVNPSMVDHIQLYKNYYPAAYAGNVSSILQIETRSAEKSKGFVNTIELNNLAGSLNSQFGFGPQLSGQISIRSTLQDLSNTSLFNVAYQGNESVTSNLLDSRKLFESLNPSFRFYDVYTQLNSRLNSKSTISFQYFQSEDGFTYHRELEFGLLRGGKVTRNLETYNEKGKWKNQALSFNYKLRISDQANTSISLSKSYFTQYENNELSVDRGPKSLDDLSNGRNYKNNVNLWNLRWSNQYTFPSKLILNGGLQVQFVEVNIALNPKPLYPEIISSNSRLNHQTSNTIPSAFLELASSKQNPVQGALSLRSSYDIKESKLFFLPQARFSWQLDKAWKLNGSLGKYVQFLRTSSHEGPLGGSFEFFVISDGKRFPSLQAGKASIGISNLSHTWGFELEPYFHQMKGIVEHLLVDPGFDPDRPFRTLKYQLRSGKGKAYGCDITLRKHRGKYTGWLTYSLSKNTITIARINAGAPYPSEYDRRHQLKWINYLQLGKWKLNAAFTFSSGRPYLDYEGFMGKNRTQNYRVNIQYLNPYRRFDLGVKYTFRPGSTKASIGVDIFNALNHQNVRYLQYAYALQGEETTNSNLRSLILGNQLEMLPFTPTLSFQWEF